MSRCLTRVRHETKEFVSDNEQGAQNSDSRERTERMIENLLHVYLYHNNLLYEYIGFKLLYARESIQEEEIRCRR